MACRSALNPAEVIGWKPLTTMRGTGKVERLELEGLVMQAVISVTSALTSTTTMITEELSLLLIPCASTVSLFARFLASMFTSSLLVFSVGSMLENGCVLLSP